jgi:hypothetical protein
MHLCIPLDPIYGQFRVTKHLKAIQSLFYRNPNQGYQCSNFLPIVGTSPKTQFKNTIMRIRKK